MNFLTTSSMALAVITGVATSLQRLRDLAQYAGESWDFERPTIVEGVALDGYWSDDAPIEKASKVRKRSRGLPTFWKTSIIV